MLWIFIITAYYYYYCYHHRESFSRYNNKIQKMNKETAVCCDATIISNRFSVRSQRDESFALEIRTFIAQALTSSVQLYVQLTVWSLRLLTLCAVERYADWSIILCALQMIRCTMHWCVTERPCNEENIIIASNGCRWMGICLQKKFIFAFKRKQNPIAMLFNGTQAIIGVILPTHRHPRDMTALLSFSVSASCQHHASPFTDWVDDALH